MEISICMMVKDEEKNIRRCLNSLRPILQNIDSELIIIDTGSKDKTVEMSKKYTDKIFFHPWENDFSGMRNKSISYAKGKWILIIDADEEIINCDNIIQFIKSPKAKPFKTGLLDVKNIHNLSDDSQYAMLKSPRIFKNDGSFHYEGIVHNSPIFKEPTIDLETTIIHYGYIEENEEVLNEKFIRTSTLLKCALEKEPENIYYMFQLSVTYTSHNDYSEAYEIIKNAYELLNKCKNKSKYKYVYYQMALCSLKLEEDELAKKVCEEGLKIDNEYVDLMFYLGKAKGLLGEYEECIQAYKKYMNLCDNYNNMNINFDVTLGMYTLGQKDEALQDMVKIYFKIGNFDEVLKFASQIEKDKYIQNVLELIIRGAINSKNIKYIKNFYEEKIMSDKIKENKFFEILEKYSNEESIYEIFSIYNNDYSKLYLLRHKYNKKDISLQGVIDNITFEGDFNKLEDYFGDIIYYKLKYCSYIPTIFETVWDKNINRYLDYILKKYEDFSNVVVKYINYFKDEMNYKNLRINKILCRYVLLVDKIYDSEYEWIFKYYLSIGVRCIKYVYNDYLMEEKYINFFKDEEEKFLILIKIAMENKEYKKNYIQYLRKSLEVYPYMKKGIEIFLEDLKMEVDYDNNEFETYKKQIKKTIESFIDIDDFRNAETLIKEYEGIVNNDLNIVLFKSQIAIGKLKSHTKHKKRCLVLCHFFSVYTKNFLEKLKNDYDIEFDVLTMDENYKVKIDKNIIENVFIYRNIDELTDKINLIEKYDIIHIHFLAYFYGLVAKQIRKKCDKIIVTIWGSDYYRTTQEQKQFQKNIFEIADNINFGNENTLINFNNYYNKVYSSKLSICRFGLIQLDYIKAFINDDKTEIKELLSLPKDSIIITCGYNASPEQNHLSIIDSILKVKNQLPANCYFLFPMTYGEKSLFSIVRERLRESGIKYRIYDQFLSEEDTAKLRLVSDIMIQVQTTDQLSGSMQEYLYADNVIITGSWLPYSVFKNKGIYFIEVDKVEEVGKKLMYSVRNLHKLKNKCGKNKDIIWNMTSWEKAIDNWIHVYKKEI
ncbi:hypothetical protein psyc5s11_46920 [Clostridium gelidum]|uniref:Glycosyltransferase n=1 Tax=Clostridium gelidum TaxID=704125 RepID=A0ABM7T9M6_9CLOT|nr:glycosyltransferase [Clostridium gelidum]BCZ48625.1 hypothetical protein psyc5s11_46920 [Clostridium gelidum]